MGGQGTINYQMPPLSDSSNQNQSANPNVIQLDPLVPSNRRSLIQNQSPSANSAQTVPNPPSNAQQQSSPVAYSASENNAASPNNNFVTPSIVTNATHANVELTGDRLELRFLNVSSFVSTSANEENDSHLR